MAKVVDRWHLARPPADATPCGEHQASGRLLTPSRDHGVGKRWQLRYRDASGQQRKENFAKKANADARAGKVKSQLDSGTYVARESLRESLQDVAERWRTSAAGKRESTTDNVERALRLHVYPQLGRRPVGGIKRADIREWVADRAKVLEPVSLRTPFNALSALMADAAVDGLIPGNPCRGVELPDVRRDEVVPLDPLVVRALIAAASPRYRAAVRLAAATGLRGGEVFGLEARHLDLDAGVVEIEQQLVGPDRGAPYIGEPKTEKSYRTLPLPESATAELRAHLTAFPLGAVEIEDRSNPRKPKTRHAQLVFPSEVGAAVRRGSWSKAWARQVRRTDKALTDGGSPLRVPDDTTLHDLRHFYASVLIKHGATVKKVQRRLGHAKPSITLDYYVHLWDDDEDDTAEVIDRIIG